MPGFSEKYEEAIVEHGATLFEAMRGHAIKLAAECNVTVDGAAQALLAHLRLSELGMGQDGRSIPWRVRLRFYDEKDNFKDPIGDSDHTLPANKPGNTIIHSLPDVCGWISTQVTEFHGTACAGMDRATLKRKLPGLRTQMSNRKDGTGVLTVSYSAIVSTGWQGATETRKMLARCDIERV